MARRDASNVPHVFGVEEVRGYRAWTLIGDHDLIRLESASWSAESSGASAIWPTNRWFEAQCLVKPDHNREGGGIPVESCSCGIYSAKSFQHLASMGYPYYGDFADKAVGEILYAGKVIEGSQGWKGERARISKLWLPVALWQYVEPLEAAYGVPVGFVRLDDRARTIEMLYEDDDEEVVA